MYRTSNRVKFENVVFYKQIVVVNSHGKGSEVDFFFIFIYLFIYLFIYFHFFFGLFGSEKGFLIFLYFFLDSDIFSKINSSFSAKGKI